MPTSIYHITHVNNLPSIAELGLLCDQEVALGTTFHSIAHNAIKQIRAETQVPCAPGGTLDEYVPFYFAPRSPMLYTINEGNVPSVTDRQTQIVHLVLSADDLMDAQECAFTNGHAIMGLSDFFTDLMDLTELDWTAINTPRWGTYYDPTDETKRKKQSEFLARTAVAWEQVQSIGVPSDSCAERVLELLEGCAHIPPVEIQRSWYYW